MISVVVLTKNEEKNIEDCLKTLLWCDEILVIDDYSIDKTVIIAKKYTKHVFSHNLEDNFSAQRNFALEKAKGDWILFVDADERVSKTLAEEIQEKISSPSKIDGFYIKRDDFMWGKKLQYGETADVQLVRLAKKNAGKWKGIVHEIWDIHGMKGVLQNPLEHYPHQTLSEFLEEINYYTTLRAAELYKKKTPVSGFSILLYAKGKFFQNYFLKLGFLDGISGLLVAILMSFHSFLVRGKLWLLQH